LKTYLITESGLYETAFESSLSDDNNKFWLILTPAELEENLHNFSFNIETVYDCLHNIDAPKLDIYEKYSFGILNIIRINEDESCENLFTINELDFYLTEKYIIFICNTDLKIFQEIKDEVSTKGALHLCIDKILYNLIDKMTVKDCNFISQLEQEIEEVEKDVIEGKTKDYIKDIIALKKILLFLKRYYESLVGIVEDLSENENGMLDENSLRYFVILFSRVERLNAKVAGLRDSVTQVRESYEAQIDINTNNIMRLFTVITAIFSALSLIVGWYGMNFPTMPEFSWAYGYSFVIILSITVVAVCIFLFKKKKLM
jgi:magnesium transporter